MRRKDMAWQAPELSRQYLENIRGAIPLAAEQIDVMVRVIETFLPGVEDFLDIGCGDGILASAVIKKYPGAAGTLVDFSSTMLKEARKRLDKRGKGKLRFIKADFGVRGWAKTLAKSSFDAVVSGYAIHHQPDGIKKRIYKEVFGLLRPGGVFINIEHVSSPAKRLSAAFDDLFIDSLYAAGKKTGAHASRAQVAAKYHDRPDRAANILSPVETQCSWLKTIGFADVDCYFKVFELAVFGGKRPEARKG